MIGLKILHHFLIQSKIKAKPIATHSDTFSRTFNDLHVLHSSLGWFAGLTVPFVIHRSDYVDFPLTMFNQLKTALIYNSIKVMQLTIA